MPITSKSKLAEFNEAQKEVLASFLRMQIGIRQHQYWIENLPENSLQRIGHIQARDTFIKQRDYNPYWILARNLWSDKNMDLFQEVYTQIILPEDEQQ